MNYSESTAEEQIELLSTFQYKAGFDAATEKYTDQLKQKDEALQEKDSALQKKDDEIAALKARIAELQGNIT